MSDFLKQNLVTANDYLDRTLSIPSAIDIGPAGAIIKSETSFSLRELICSLLAGDGIKLPNLQICLKANISGLLSAMGVDVTGILSGLQDALNNVQSALDSFIAHTNIENVIGRLNDAIAEFAAIANMINFCGTPITPKAIPNVMGDMFGSFTGAGQDVLDKLGKIADSEIGGCLGGGGGSGLGGFNGGIFVDGVLKDLSDLIGNDLNNLINAPAGVLAAFVNDINNIAGDIRSLVEFENNFKGTESSGNGGSTFSPLGRLPHTGVGVAIDPDTMTLAQAQRLGAGLQAAFNQLSPYELEERTDPSIPGRNIFDYILEPELLEKLRNQTDPEIQGVTRVPQFDYCGKQIGYTDVPDEATAATSAGQPLVQNSQPAVTGLASNNIVVNTPANSTTNLTNPNPVANTEIPNSPLGSTGDKKGDMAISSDYIYTAIADFDGTTNIWSRRISNTDWTDQQSTEDNTNTSTSTSERIETDVAINANRIQELQQTVAIMQADNDSLRASVSGLQTTVGNLQTELDTNQQSAENITTGVIARLNTIKSNTQGYITTWQAVPAFNTGDSAVDGLLNDIVDQLIDELQAQVTDINAQIALLGEDFTI